MSVKPSIVRGRLKLPRPTILLIYLAPLLDLHDWATRKIHIDLWACPQRSSPPGRATSAIGGA